MIELHQRVIVLGFSEVEDPQPLVYSAAHLSHAAAERLQAPRPSGVPAALGSTEQSRATRSYRVVFWFWQPPGQRRPHRQGSRAQVTDTELARLQTGELVEVAYEYTFPADLAWEHLKRDLLVRWERQCVERLGYLPEVYRDLPPLTVADPIRAAEQERNAIVIGG